MHMSKVSRNTLLTIFALFTTLIGVVIGVKSNNYQVTAEAHSAQPIPTENVSIIHNEDTKYLVVHTEDTQSFYLEVNDLSKDKRSEMVAQLDDHYNPDIGLTNQQFQEAIQMIQQEMSEKGYIKDQLHVTNGFNGFLRKMVMDHFINDGDTIRTHYDKVDQLINHMNQQYKRTEKVLNHTSTVTYTEYGKMDQFTQTITNQTSELGHSLKKIINALKERP